MITGSTGYVAGWIVKKFLENGYELNLPVRDLSNQDKISHLLKLEKQYPGKINFFEADLLIQNSYFESMQGCEIVIHTASPFKTNVKNPMQDLIKPALLGTENVLKSVNKTKSVKKVILTSSVAAIVGDAIEFKNGERSERHWNTSSSEKHQPYNYSKTLAEKKAWKINSQQERWELITINPSLVIGPSLNGLVTSESYSIIKQLGSGQFKQGAPEYYIAVVDVRDVAQAHYNAATDDSAHGRYILSAQNTSLLEVSNYISERYPDYPLPQKKIPKFLVWSLAPLMGLKRNVVAKNVGYPWKLDNSKSKMQLQIQYSDIKSSAQEFFAQIYNEKY